MPATALRLLLLTALLLLPMGCGDDDSTPADSTPAGTASLPAGSASGSASPPAGGTSETPVGTATSTGAPGNTSGEPTTESEGAPTLQVVHAQLFASTCVPCHGSEGGLSLANDAGLRDRLFAASLQLPSMPQVTPGDPAESYLWHKIANTHRDVGGSGNVMPPFAPLSAAQLDLVQAWIEGGAN